MEEHYATHEVVPTKGCLKLFKFLNENGVKIALTTGYYRKVITILLRKLGWDHGLDKTWLGLKDSLIQLSLSSDDVEDGRPAPDLIYLAMRKLGVSDPRRVIKIGDTPSDLESGVKAHCLMSLGLTNGTHSRKQLLGYRCDGLLSSLEELLVLL